MFQNINFIYDDIRSEDMGLALVKVNDDNMIPFGTSQSIIETKLKAIDEPLFHGIERNPQSFQLQFAILDDDIRWDYDKRQEIVNWLFQSDYKPFISADNESICYYIIATGENQRWDNGLQQGFITINFRMMTPFAYTIKEFTNYQVDSNNNVIELVNLSNIKDYKYYPIIEFTLKGNATDISFKNLTDGGRELKFTGLSKGETVFINNKTGEIISSTGLPRLSKCNRNWLRLVEGLNKVLITINNGGSVDLTTEMQFPMNF